MNIKEKLIEELKKDNWFIDTYYCMDRLNAIAQLYPKIKELSVANYVRMQSRYLCGTKHDWCFLAEPSEREKDLTQLANGYLEEYQPDIWLHSVLAAFQIALKIETCPYLSSEWDEIHSGLYIERGRNYRINATQEQKLVPDEIWDILDDKFNSIAKNEDGKLYARETRDPEKGNSYWYGDGECLLKGFKCLKNAPIRVVDWRDSLCIRPKK